MVGSNLHLWCIPEHDLVKHGSSQRPASNKEPLFPFPQLKFPARNIDAFYPVLEVLEVVGKRSLWARGPVSEARATTWFEVEVRAKSITVGMAARAAQRAPRGNAPRLAGSAHSVGRGGGPRWRTSDRPVLAVARGSRAIGGNGLRAARPGLGSRQRTRLGAVANPDAAALESEFGLKGSVSFQEGRGGLVKAVLTHVCGSSCEVYLYGANIVSWKQASGDEVLYVRPDAKFDMTKAISGGIPICFPQFGPGPNMKQVR